MFMQWTTWGTSWRRGTNSLRQNSCCLKPFPFSMFFYIKLYASKYMPAILFSDLLVDCFVFLCRSDFAAAWMNLGIVQNSLGKFEEAEQSYRNAIRFRRKYPDCYYNLGRLVRFLTHLLLCSNTQENDELLFVQNLVIKLNLIKKTICFTLGIYTSFSFVTVCWPKQTHRCPECLEKCNCSKTWPQPGLEQYGHSAGQYR